MSATCTACHTGINNGTIDKPFVFQIANPGYDPTAGLTHTTLAGGSFYWVSQGFDLMGHNVVGVGATQVLGRQPPGDSTSTTFDFLTCAGTNGCHGDLSVASQVKAIWGGHHSPEESLSTDGSTLGRSYRLLLGISGVEDPNWEYSLAVGDHNQYFGNVRSGDDDLDTRTISHLCAKCHGDFHSGAGLAGVSADASFVSPWIRHPVDFDMGDAAGSEYTFYGGSGSYNVTTPLASDNIVLGVLSTVTLGGVGDGSAIITCITCHRAHGSPYDYSLRWDYKNWPGGALDGGCYDCHTVKI
ncbi:MAG: cytochrome c3 family protein [Thermodesulfobacteriota bacterium]